MGHEHLQGMMQLIVTTQGANCKCGKADDDMVDKQVVSAIRKFRPVELPEA